MTTSQKLAIFNPRLSPCSGQNLPHNLTVHVRQTALNAVVAEGQTFVVEPEQMQHRCMKIMPGNRVLLRLPTYLVSCTIGDSRLQPRSGSHKPPRLLTAPQG